ncbi:uncharacterized protein LOC144441082 [Glandiceps talaboti]
MAYIYTLFTVWIVVASVNLFKGASADCTDDQFQCNSGLCIPLSYKCDQFPDCPDQEDEDNCPDKDCNAPDFKCDNSVCILGYLACNGVPNCKNGEDEKCGPECHVCDGWSKLTEQCHPGGYKFPPHCEKTTQQCATTIKRNKRGKLSYSIGCKSKKDCEKAGPARCKKDPVKIGKGEKCTICCEGNLCNDFSKIPNIKED